MYLHFSSVSAIWFTPQLHWSLSMMPPGRQNVVVTWYTSTNYKYDAVASVCPLRIMAISKIPSDCGSSCLRERGRALKIERQNREWERQTHWWHSVSVIAVYVSIRLVSLSLFCLHLSLSLSLSHTHTHTHTHTHMHTCTKTDTHECTHTHTHITLSVAITRLTG